MNDAKLLMVPKTTTEVVTLAVNEVKKATKRSPQSQTLAQEMFLAAVLSAGTHNELVGRLSILKADNASSVANKQIGVFLRYADAVDKFLESTGNMTFAGAFIFGAVRCMLAV